MANWTDFSEAEYLPAIRTALIWQAVLGVLASLMLDMGETRRAWGIAFLCHWAIIWLVLFCRPLHPTWLDLAIVRHATLPLLILIMLLEPWFLQLTGISPDAVP